MNIYSDIHQLPQIKNLVLTIGSFDGVHKGHQELIASINERAKEIGGESGLMTFHPHPRMVIEPDKKKTIHLLTTIEERIERLKKSGLNNLFIVPFSVDFANMDAEKYVEEFLVAKFHPARLVIGYDHKFGKGRKGDINLLLSLKNKFDYEVEQISQQKTENITYSSTNIRNLLLDGKIQLANELLGYCYQINGIIAHGDKRGTSIGFPTANIQLLNDAKLIPQQGVYAVRSTINGSQYEGMLNIGTRPTFDGINKTIENHLFNFTGDIYGYAIETEFVAKIREEKKFQSKEALVSQLENDKMAAEQLLNDN